MTRLPSALALHRAKLEHDCFAGNPKRVALVREAAREYDTWLASTKQTSRKHSNGKPRGRGITVATRKVAA